MSVYQHVLFSFLSKRERYISQNKINVSIDVDDDTWAMMFYGKKIVIIMCREIAVTKEETITKKKNF